MRWSPSFSNSDASVNSESPPPLCIIARSATPDPPCDPGVIIPPRIVAGEDEDAAPLFMRCIFPTPPPP